VRCTRYNLSVLSINVRENRRCNQECTIQRHRQHWTQDTGRRQTKANTTKAHTKNNKTMSNMDLTYNRGLTLVLSKGKLFLLHIRHPSYYSYIYISLVLSSLSLTRVRSVVFSRFLLFLESIK